jgi:iron complex outermembrane receptor protein
MYTMRGLVPDGLPAPYPAYSADLESLGEGVPGGALPIQGTEVGIGSNALQVFNPALGVYPQALKPDQKSGQLTREINMSGIAIDRRLSWLGGFFSSHDTGQGTQAATQLTALTASPPPADAGVPVIGTFASPYIHNESWAAFTQNDYKFTDWFSITGGGRYTQEKLAQDVSAFGYLLTPTPLPAPYLCLGGPNANLTETTELGCQVSQAAKFSGTSYLGSLNFQLAPDMLLYLKTARGFRGGALRVRAPSFPAAKPETATDYEVGFKSDFLNHTLRTNLAAYQTNYANKQETAIIQINGFSSTPIENAAKARIRGFEAEVTALPMDHLTLRGSALYIDAIYLSFPDAVPSYCNACTVNASGQPMGSDTSPPPSHVTLDGGGRYVVPLPVGAVSVDADYSWHSKIPANSLNEIPWVSTAIQDSWRQAIGLLNVNLSYELPDQGLIFTAFGTNVTNKHYQVQGLTFNTFGTTGYTQDPAMWGVSVKLSLGGG